MKRRSNDYLYFMKITIVAATRLEIAPIIQHYSLISNEKEGFMSNDSGSIHVLITGMGMLNTAAETAIYLSKNPRDIMIDAGIAGAFNRDIKIGEVCHVISETYGDFGVEDGDEFKDFFEMGFIDQHQDAFEYGLLKPYATEKFLINIQYLRQVSSITVNKVHGVENTIERIMKKYNADIENMEGLAFFYVCHKLNTPCLEIRSISNYVERRNKDNWDISLSVKNLNHQLIYMIDDFL